MPKATLSTLGIIVVLLAVAGGIYLSSTGGLPQQGSQQQEEEAPQELLSIAGRVTAVNPETNSFTLLQPKEERSFVVKLGQDTEFIRLVFPFDIANPPADAAFVPEREEVAIDDLKVNDQVFVRSSSVIKTGQDISNPVEVQILP